MMRATCPAIVEEGLRPGFADPVFDAQRVFRRLLDAMAHPGKIVALEAALDPPAPLSCGSAALCLTLVDAETPLWLDVALAIEPVLRYLHFHCGMPIARSPADARFALIADARAMPALERFDAGDDERPERSATLIINVRALRSGEGRLLTGPGIAGDVRLAADGLAEGFWSQWRANNALFPRGIDAVLVAAGRIAALPRTTAVDG
jgi:alpha-D-ribose 1-methylphosphonate 5-triphosphate synthase subunit PhnH